jgi:hypothetical protein
MYLSTIAFLTTALAGHAIAAPTQDVDPLFCLEKKVGTYCSGNSLIACGAGPGLSVPVVAAPDCQCEEFVGLNSAHCLDGVHKKREAEEKREVAAIAGFSCRGKETGRHCDGSDLWACGASGGPSKLATDCLGGCFNRGGPTDTFCAGLPPSIPPYP